MSILVSKIFNKTDILQARSQRRVHGRMSPRQRPRKNFAQVFLHLILAVCGLLTGKACVLVQLIQNYRSADARPAVF